MNDIAEEYLNTTFDNEESFTQFKNDWEKGYEE
jgi:hypothetical protein